MKVEIKSPYIYRACKKYLWVKIKVQKKKNSIISHHKSTNSSITTCIAKSRNTYICYIVILAHTIFLTLQNTHTLPNKVNLRCIYYTLLYQVLIFYVPFTNLNKLQKCGGQNHFLLSQTNIF